MMREYAKVKATFWTGDTGRAIRTCGYEAQLVALYLMTCPSASMLGLYYLPIVTLQFETGIPIEGAYKALQSLATVGFAYYDDETQHVWVPEFASHQIAESLEPTDKRVIGIRKAILEMRKCRFFKAFIRRYNEPFHLGMDSELEDDAEPLRSPTEAPSKPGAGAGPGSEAETRTRSIGGLDTSGSRTKPFPPNFAPDSATIATAAFHGLELDDQIAACRDHSLATGKLSRDWQAEVRLWMQRSARFEQQAASRGRPRKAIGSSPTELPLAEVVKRAAATNR